MMNCTNYLENYENDYHETVEHHTHYQRKLRWLVWRLCEPKIRHRIFRSRLNTTKNIVIDIGYKLVKVVREKPIAETIEMSHIRNSLALPILLHESTRMSWCRIGHTDSIDPISSPAYPVVDLIDFDVFY